MRKIFIILIWWLVGIAHAKAQSWDYQYLFHYGREYWVTVCILEGDSKEQAMKGKEVHRFEFGREGNLYVYNGKELEDLVVRGNKGDIEFTYENKRIEIINMSQFDLSDRSHRKIIVPQYDAKKEELLIYDKYELNKRGFPIKRERAYNDTKKKYTRTYNYIEYHDDGVWKIRKVKDPERPDKQSWYEYLYKIY